MDLTNKQKYLLALGFVFVLLGAAVYGLFVRPPKLGLDLRGGLHVVLTAKEKPGAPVTEEAMEQTKRIIDQRVNRLGVAEPGIERQGGRNIMVQLPGVKEPQKALEVIGKTALLEFKPVLNFDEEEKKYVLGPTLLTGKALSSAKVGEDELGRPAVDITFNKEGAKKFDVIAKEFYQKQLAIVLDNVVMSAPVIQSTEYGGKAQITGDFTIDEARRLVVVLEYGALPVELEISENRVVGPTLGHDSLIAGLKACIIGLVLVALFMVGFYRVLGFLSWLTLTVFAVLLGGLLVLVNATLTLPGIAGIILMIGVAADSSIIVFERIKEEARGGKTIRTAMDTGFTHGFRTFLDADLVTLTTAIILFWFGVGPVRGFALTLMLGIACDIFTSLFFTRSVLGLLARTRLVKKPRLLGMRGEVE
jgi:preprotein translocase subunit SecD